MRDDLITGTLGQGASGMLGLVFCLDSVTATATATVSCSCSILVHEYASLQTIDSGISDRNLIFGATKNDWHWFETLGYSACAPWLERHDRQGEFQTAAVSRTPHTQGRQEVLR